MTERQLLGKLASIRRRARAMLLLYGIGLLLAVLTAGFLLPALADYNFHLPGPLRLALSIALLLVLGYSLWRFLFLPVRARISLDDVALKLEARFPEFNDRLASAVNFITHPDSQQGVSPVLVREVVRNSGQSTQGVPLTKVLTLKATSLGVTSTTRGSFSRACIMAWALRRRGRSSLGFTERTKWWAGGTALSA